MSHARIERHLDIYRLIDENGKQFDVPRPLADLNGRPETFVLSEAMGAGAVVTPDLYK